MNWYYVSGNERTGPVEQAEFERLAREGVITGSTLVWAEGMKDWRAYSQVIASLSAPGPGGGPNLGGMVCSECGRSFAADQVIRIGGGYVCAACKPIAVQKLREGVPDTSAEQVRKDHIKHEASVKSIGFLYLLGAAVWLVGGLGMLAVSIGGSRSGRVEGAVTMVLLLGLSGLLFWLGLGVRRLKRSARIGAGVLSGLGLLAFPTGTLINAYILYLLFSKKGATVFSDEYKHVIEQTPHVRYRTSIVVWILLGLLLLLMGAALIVPLIARLHR